MANDTSADAISIALASDHAGYRAKEAIERDLRRRGYRVQDFGTDSEAPVDYPDFVRPAAESVARNENHLGIVFGGSGNGEAMVANKVKGIRCAVCWSRESARLAKAHNNANMISIGARMVSESEIIGIVETWLDESFEGGRHIQRIRKMEP